MRDTIHRHPCSLQRPVPLDLAISRSLIASHLHEHRVDGEIVRSMKPIRVNSSVSAYLTGMVPEVVSCRALGHYFKPQLIQAATQGKTTTAEISIGVSYRTVRFGCCHFAFPLVVFPHHTIMVT